MLQECVLLCFSLFASLFLSLMAPVTVSLEQIIKLEKDLVG